MSALDQTGFGDLSSKEHLSTPSALERVCQPATGTPNPKRLNNRQIVRNRYDLITQMVMTENASAEQLYNTMLDLNEPVTRTGFFKAISHELGGLKKTRAVGPSRPSIAPGIQSRIDGVASALEPNTSKKEQPLPSSEEETVDSSVIFDPGFLPVSREHKKWR